MKSSMKKDVGGGGVGGGGGGGNGAPPLTSLPCFDFKTFVLTLIILTLVLAGWQFQPYEFLMAYRASSCDLPATVAVADSDPDPYPSSNTLVEESKMSSSVTNNMTTTTTTQRSNFYDFSAPADPNKREFRPFGSAAALFVAMGAYRGGPATFAVVGLASKPAHVYSDPWFKCEWMPNPNPAAPDAAVPIRAKAFKMLPDWGYGRVYTVVVVNCTFPSNPNVDNAGGKLLLHAYYSTKSRRYEKFVAMEEAPGSYDEAHYRPPFKYEYLYCGSSLYGNLSASRIREWMAYHVHLFGPSSHFVFHDAGGVSPEVRAVLEPWIRLGRATLQDIRGQEDYDGYYYNQFLVVNDCLHRYRHAANWTFFFDVDEYIYLPDGRSLDAVMASLSEYTQFTIEQNQMNSKLCVQDRKKDYTRQWGFEKLVFRNSITGVRRDRKYAIQAKNAYSTGVHMSENIIGKTNHKTEDMIRYYHYHNSINVLGEPCREFVPVPAPGKKTWFEKTPWVYDDGMKRKADVIKNFEKQMIGSSGH